MGKLMDKVLNFMGFEDEEEVVEEVVEESSPRGKKGNLFSLPTQRNVKVVALEPNRFDDVQMIADNLKNRRAVIVNLEKADKDLGRRVVDFISGVTYALNGTIARVGTDIFFCAPSNMEVDNELRLREEKEIKALFPWLK